MIKLINRIPLGTNLSKTINALMVKRQNTIIEQDAKIAELQSTITAQEDIIKRLKEDGERLFKDFDYIYYGENEISCRLCDNVKIRDAEIEHDADCPITLHTQLMNELGEK